MRVRSHHVVLSGAIIAIAVLLSFAGAFLVDAANTNRTYDALATHRVHLAGHLLGCAWGGSSRSSMAPTIHLCRVAYDYRGYNFTEVMGYGQPQSAFVDPANPTLHMTQVHFVGGPEATDGDLTFAGLLIAGAIAVGTLHELHRRRRRRRV